MKVRSMRGVEIDMGAFLAQNEHAIAVGNAGLNARGDAIGPGGKIIKTRDQMAQDYHRGNPNAVQTVALQDLPDEVMPASGSDKLNIEFVDPKDAVDAIQKASKRKIKDTEE